MTIRRIAWAVTGRLAALASAAFLAVALVALNLVEFALAGIATVAVWDLEFSLNMAASKDDPW